MGGAGERSFYFGTVRRGGRVLRPGVVFNGTVATDVLDRLAKAVIRRWRTALRIERRAAVFGSSDETGGRD